jgi:hypothetical protein
MRLLAGSSRLVGDVEAGLAQAVDPRLEPAPQRFGTERGTSRQYGIGTKVQFDLHQLFERNLGFYRNGRLARRKCLRRRD